jgi:hypothetical protein
MNRVLLASSSALALALSAGPSNPCHAKLPPRTEDWFRWGDYDSLIAVLEPWLRDTAQASAERARAFLYLGVAYQAGNVRRLSDSAFYKACDLDTAIVLDRYYVAPEILDHFHAVAADCRSRKEARNPPSAAPAPGGLNAPPPARSSSAGVSGKAGSHALLWWTAGGMLAATALAGGVLLLLQPERKPIDSVTVIDGR